MTYYVYICDRVRVSHNSHSHRLSHFTDTTNTNTSPITHRHCLITTTPSLITEARRLVTTSSFHRIPKTKLNPYHICTQFRFLSPSGPFFTRLWKVVHSSSQFPVLENVHAHVSPLRLHRRRNCLASSNRKLRQHCQFPLVEQRRRQSQSQGNNASMASERRQRNQFGHIGFAQWTEEDC